MIGIGVPLHRLDAAHHHIGDFRAKILGDLHLGSGDSHGLGKVPVIYRADIYKFL